MQANGCIDTYWIGISFIFQLIILIFKVQHTEGKRHGKGIVFKKVTAVPSEWEPVDELVATMQNSKCSWDRE